MEDLIQDTSEDTLFDVAPATIEKPNKEDVSIALINEGNDVLDPEVQPMKKRLIEQQNIGDDSFVQQSKAKLEEEKKQALYNKYLNGETVDLVELDNAIAESQRRPNDWKVAAVTKHAIGTQNIVVNTQEEADRLNALWSTNEARLAKQQALAAGQDVLIKSEEDQNIVGWWADFLGFAIEPGVVNANLALVSSEATGEANIAGFALPSESLDALADKFQSLPIEEQAGWVEKLFTSLNERNSQLGLSKNPQLNLMIGGMIAERLNLDQTTTAGSNAVANVIGTLDVIGIGAMLKQIGGITKTGFRNLLGKIVGRDAKPKIIRPKVDINPNLDIKSKRGSLGDELQAVDSTFIERMTQKAEEEAAARLKSGERVAASSEKETAELILQEEVDKAAKEVGLDLAAIEERSRPTVSGGIDDVSLPPFATNPRLRPLMNILDNTNDKMLLGSAADRDAVITKLHDNLKEGFAGHPHLSKSYIAPPKEGDALSLGTAVVRFGKNGGEGYANKQAATVLKNNLKATGEAATVVEKEGKWWVEVTRRHVIDEKDAGVFNSVTGQRLTSILPRATSGFMGWSKTVKNVADEMHPQAMTSWARDAGSAIKRELQTIAKPFFRLQAKSNKTEYNMVSEALYEGEKLQKTFTNAELRANFPGISKGAVEAYRAYTSASEGMAVVRAMSKRKTLFKAGHKELTVGDELLYGTVLSERPSINKLAVEEGGDISKAHLADDSVFRGDKMYDPVNREVIAVTDEVIDDIYKAGGKVIKVANKYQAGEAGQFSHIIVKDKKAYDIRELPQLPQFGREGYVAQRFYEDASFVVKADVKATVNGVEGMVSKGVGIAKTQAEANRIVQTLKAADPEVKLTVEKSRELRYLLDEVEGGANGPSWAKRRQDEILVGPDGKKAPTLSLEESFQRSIGNVGSEKLQQTAGILKQRFTNQFKNLLHPQTFSRGFPRKITEDMVDVAAAEKAGLRKKDVFLDARTLHYNIAAMEHEASNILVKEQRRFFAELATVAGAKDNVVAQIASKALTKAADVDVVAKAKALAAITKIGLSIGYQVPQNLLSTFGLLTMQGFRGLRALKDIPIMARTHLTRASGGADYKAALKRLAKSLDQDEKFAADFMEKIHTTGFIGSVEDLDNVVSHAVKGGGLTGTIRKTVNAISKPVSVSIEVGNLGFWSAATRKSIKEFTKAGKKIGTKDFWENVRQSARGMSQNQNKSDLILFERNNNLLTVPMQFTQHLFKLGGEMVGILKKAGGFQSKSALVGTQAEAIQAIGIYAAVFGAGGAGITGVQLLNRQLPEWMQDPQTKAERAAVNFVNGGIIDAIVNLPSDRSELAISASVSPGGSVDIFANMVKGLQIARAEGSLSVDVFKTFGGAAWSSVSELFHSFSAVPSFDLITDQPTLEEALPYITEFVKQAGLGVARNSKTFSDAELAYMEYNLGKALTKTAGKIKGDITKFEAIGQIFGFKPVGALVQRDVDFQDIVQGKYVKSISTEFNRQLRVSLLREVSPGNEEQFALWMEKQQANVKSLAKLVPEGSIDHLEEQIYASYLDMLNKDKEFFDRIKSVTKFRGNGQGLLTLLKNPSLSEDKKKLLRTITDNMKQIREAQ